METTNTSKFTDVFKTCDDINIQTNKFLKRLRQSTHKCFEKVRVGIQKETEYEQLYTKWVEARHKDDKTSKEMTKKLEN